MNSNDFILNIIAALNKQLSKAQIKNDIKGIDNSLYVKVIAKLATTLSKSQLKNQLKKLNNLYVNVGANVKIDKNTKNQLQKNIKALQQLVSDLEIGLKVSKQQQRKIYSDIHSIRNKAQQTAQKNPIGFNLEIKKGKLISDVEYLGKRYSKLFSNVSATQKYENLMNNALNVSNKRQLADTRAELSAFTSELKANGLAVRSTGDKWRNLVDRSKDLFGAAALVRVVFSQLRESVSTFLQLDTAMTNLYKVQEQITSREQFSGLLTKWNKLAQKLSVTTESLINSSAEWSKIGFDLDMSEQLAQITAIFEKTAEISNDKANSTLVSAAQAFTEIGDLGEEDYVERVEAIGNKINAVGNKYAISSEGISDALQNSSAALRMANNDLDESIAMITAGNKIFQSPDEMGNTLKVVSARLRGQKGELEALNEDTEGMIESVSKVQTQILNLTGNKVNIFESDNETLKSTYEILLEIGKTFDSLTDKDQASLLEIIFGKQRMSAGASLLLNYKELEKVKNDSMNAGNSMAEEYSKYMESAEAHIVSFKEKLVETYSTFMSGNMIKYAADTGSAFLDLVNNTDLLKHSLLAIASINIGKGMSTIGATIASTAKQMNTLGSALEQVKNLPLDNLLRVKSLNEIGNATKGLTEKNLKLLLSQKNLEEQDRILMLRRHNLTEEEALAKLEKMGLTTATNAQTVANTAEAASTITLSGVMTSLKASIAGVGLSIKAAFINNPFGFALTAATTIISVATTATNKYKQALDEAKAALDESTTSFKEVTDEISDLREEITTCKDRLAELQELADNGTISVADEKELETLKKTNDELERKLALKKAEQIEEQEKILDDNEKLLNKTISSKYKTTQFTAGASNVETALTVTIPEELGYALREFNGLNNSLEKGIIDQAEFDKRVKSIKDDITEYSEIVNTSVDAYDKLIEAGVSLEGEDLNLYNTLKDLQDRYLLYTYTLYGTTEAYQALSDEQKKKIILDKFEQQGLSKTDAEEVYKNMSDEQKDEFYEIEFAFKAPDKSDYKTASDYAVAYVDAMYNSAQEEVPNLDEKPLLSFSEAFNASDFAESKEKLLDLAKSGEITASVLESTEDYKTLLDNTGLLAEDAKDQILEMLSAQEKLSGATSGLEKLKSAYEEFKDEDLGFVTASTLESLPDAFKELEGFDLFSQIAGDPTNGKKKIQQAFNDIVTEYIKYQATLGQLNSRNSDIYIANLKNMGISNAKSVVNAALEIYKDVDDAMSEIENLTDEELQHYVDALNEKGVKTSDVYSQIGKSSAKLYGDLGKQYQSDLNNYVKALNEKKRLYNEWIADVNKANSKVGGSTYSSAEGYKSDAERQAVIKAATNANIAQKQLEEDLKLIEANFEVNYAPESSNSNGSSSKTTFDWLQRRVNTLNKSLDTLQAKLENVFSINSKDSIIDKEIKKTKELIKTYEKQAKVYKQQALASAKATKTKSGDKKSTLSKDLQSKIQNGQIKGTRSQLIKTYGEKTANAIQEYQEYWDQYLESLTNIQTGKTSLRNLTIEKYQNRQDMSDQKADYYSILSESATTAKKQNAYLDKQAKQLQETYKWQIKIANAEHNSIKAKQLQVDLQNQLVELQKQQIDNIHDETSNKISSRDLKAENSLSSTQIKNAYLKDADALIAESASITSDTSISKGTKNILSATYGKGTDWYKKNITQTLDSYSKCIPKGIATRIKNAIANGTAISDSDLKAVKKIDSKLYSQLKSYNDAYQNTKKSVSDYANAQSQEDIKQAREARINAAQVDLDSSNLILENLSAQYDNATSASQKNVVIQRQIAETGINYDKQRAVLAAEYSDINGKIVDSEDYQNKLLALNEKQQKEILGLQIQIEQNLADEASAQYDLNQQLEENATSAKEKNSYDQKSLTNLQAQYSHLIQIADLSGDVTESERLRAELAQKTADSYLKQFQNLKDEYDFIISGTEHEINLINSAISQAQAKGLKSYGSYLRQGLLDSETEASKQREKLTTLNGELSNDIANGKIIVGSSQYQQAIIEIRSVEEAIASADEEVLKWQNDIRDLDWDNFKWVREQVEYLADESQFLIDVLAHDKLTKSFDIDDTSLSSVLQSLEGVNDWTDILTDAGTATLSEYANIIDSQDRSAKDYYAKSEDYMKKFQETGDTVYLEMAQNAKNTAESATKDMLSAQDSIKSIVEQSLESWESAIDVIISKYEDALDAEKDVYDYQKTVEEKTKTLNSLRKQMAALSGNDTEENQATLQKLADQIKNAQDDLNETEYDKYISDQKKLLSSFQDDVKDYISKYLDDTNSILSDICGYISTDEAKESTEKAETETLPFDQGFQEFNTTLGSTASEVVESGNRIVESIDALNDTISKNERIQKLGDELFETVSKSVSDTGSHDQNSISIYDLLNGGTSGKKIDLTDTNALIDIYDKVSEYGSDLLYGDKIYELLDELLMLQGVDVYHTSHANRGGYAKGTRNATKGWHLYDEKGLGSEAIITKDGVLKQFEGGEHVFNSEETEALHDLSQMVLYNDGYLKPIHNNPLSNIDPQWQKLLESYNPMSNLVLPSVMPLPKIAERNNGGNVTIDIGGMTVKGVNNPAELADGFINILKNNPKVQKAVRRETIDKTLPGVRFR